MPHTRGAIAISGALKEDPASPFFESDVFVTAPDPAVAVPVLSAPASWDPDPSNPGPVPAPDLKYFLADSGIAGKSLLPSRKVLDFGGHWLADPEDLYPPSPEGGETFVKAFCKVAKSGRSVAVLPDISTRPYLFCVASPSLVYS